MWNRVEILCEDYYSRYKQGLLGTVALNKLSSIQILGFVVHQLTHWTVGQLIIKLNCNQVYNINSLSKASVDKCFPMFSLLARQMLCNEFHLQSTILKIL